MSGAGTTLGPWDTLVNKRSASTDLTYFHQNTNRVCTFFVTRCTYIQCISWYRCCLAKSKMRECIWALKEAKNLGIFFEYNVLILTAIIFFTENLVFMVFWTTCIRCNWVRAPVFWLKSGFLRWKDILWLFLAVIFTRL